MPLAFFALQFKNELQYHCLKVRANSGDDVAISCKNLVNFCLVTPEIMFARLPDGSQVLVCYYMLGGYTAAPSGLYAGLCHAILVYYEQSYLCIYWTDFHDLFTNGRYLHEFS